MREYKEALFCAARSGDCEIVDVLLKWGLELGVKNPEGQTLLHIASMNGHTQLVSQLVRRGIPLDTRDSHNLLPIDYAAQAGHNEVVSTLQGLIRVSWRTVTNGHGSKAR